MRFNGFRHFRGQQVAYLSKVHWFWGGNDGAFRHITRNRDLNSAMIARQFSSMFSWPLPAMFFHGRAKYVEET
jgi:hypothetical protein